MEVNFLSYISALRQRKMCTSLSSFPFFKGKHTILFSSVFVCILEFIYYFHFLSFLIYLQERKLSHEILWLEADSHFIFLGRFFHSKDKTRSHKNVLFLGDNSMETWKKLNEIQRRDERGRVCSKLIFFSEICEPFMVAGLLILVVFKPVELYDWVCCNIWESCTSILLKPY